MKETGIKLEVKMISTIRRLTSSRGNIQRVFKPRNSWVERNRSSFLRKLLKKSQLKSTPTKIERVIAAEACTEVC